jgi:hypothetical protein
MAMPRPFQQGGLDSLCGLYAVINATRLAARPIRRLTANECSELFACLSSSLDADRRLLHILTVGSYYPTVSRLLRTASQWLESEHKLQLGYRRPFHQKPSVRTPTAFQRMADHLAAPQTSAIIGLSEPYAHWSVARAVSPNGSVLLFDSSRRRYIRYCAYPNSRPLRQRLVHRELYLIWTS